MSLLTITRGDDVTLDVVATDGGAPVDLSGAEIWFTAKLRYIDTDAEAVIAKTTSDGITVTDPLQGTAVIALVPEDTTGLDSSALWWDLQVLDGQDKVRTLASGRLVIKADVTRAIA